MSIEDEVPPLVRLFRGGQRQEELLQPLQSNCLAGPAVRNAREDPVVILLTELLVPEPLLLDRGAGEYHRRGQNSAVSGDTLQSSRPLSFAGLHSVDLREFVRSEDDVVV